MIRLLRTLERVELTEFPCPQSAVLLVDNCGKSVGELMLAGDSILGTIVEHLGSMLLMRPCVHGRCRKQSDAGTGSGR
jgi:hypothetical protein